MNKILLNSELFNLSDSENDILVNGDCVINIFNILSDIKLNVELSNDSNLTINHFNKINNSVTINVIQRDNSNVNYIHTFKVDGDYNLIYNANMFGKNSNNIIKINGVSYGNVLIDIDGIVDRNTRDNYLDENVKILTIDGNAKVMPMMHIDTNEVIANHNTAISNIRSDEQFYLMSKGISKEKCNELISDGYLYGLFKDNEDFLKQIKEN